MSSVDSAGRSLETITSAVGRIYDMTSQIASAVEQQSAVAGSELAQLATDLQVMVSRFKTEQ